MCKKYKEIVEIIEQKSIAKDVYSLWVSSPNMANVAKAGQFLDIYTSDTGKLLPRPISICEVDKKRGALRMVYRVTGDNTGTKLIAQKIEKDHLSVVGPLGNGFPLLDKKALLIGGGIGIPPMLQLAKNLTGEVDIVLGYREDLYLLDELEHVGSVYVATEDGSYGTKGNVIDAIKENQLQPEIVYACGPTPMLRAIKEYCKENNIVCYISLEEKMACGIGACLACVCKTKEINPNNNVNNTRICKDGPVFLSEEVEI